MKGLLFNLLELVVTDQFGEDAWDDVLDDAGAAGAYTAIGNYPDKEFLQLLDVLPAGAGSSAADQLRWFGRAAMPMLAQRYEVFFAPHATTRSFLLSLNDIIHPEVRKLYAGGDVPVFDFENGNGVGPNSVRMGYRSPRRFCHLAEGFVLGAADYFGQSVTLHQPECMHHGADRCLISCEFDELGSPA